MLSTRLRFLTRNLFRRRHADRDLVAELGAYAEEMNSRARPRVHTEPLREEVRAARLGADLESWARDLRYAVRMLRKSPGLTLACVLTFAVGIGANTLVFSMANALAVRGLAVPQPSEIQYLQITQRAGAAHLTSPEDLEAIRAQSSAIFSGLATASMESAGLKAAGSSQPMWASRVSGNFFAVMGIRPALGAFFNNDRTPALVLSYDYWRSRFSGDPGVIGQQAAVDGVPVTIVGVAPHGFHGFSSMIDLQGYFPRSIGVAAAADFMPGIPLVRLRSGVTRAEAQTELAVIARRLTAAHPSQDRDLGIRAMPTGAGETLSSSSEGDGPNPLHVLSAVFVSLAGLVLLLAAANVMGLLLARANARHREMGLRSALGGSRLRLARQVFLETLLLASVGAAAGMAAGSFGSATVSQLPPSIGIPLVLDFSFDWRVFAYGTAMALLVALAAGLVPAWRAASAAPNLALRRDRWIGAPRQRLRSVLVTAQVAGSLALLIVGGLFVRSLRNAQTAALGFNPSHVVNFPLDPSGAGYAASRGQQYYDQVLARVRTLPGVASADLAQMIPFGLLENGSDDIYIDAARPAQPPSAQIYKISSEYFQTLRVPLLQGRDFRSSDVASAPSVAIINRAMAERYWRGQDPLGHRLALTSDPAHTMQVVGVVGDTRQAFGDDANPPGFYIPLAQHYVSAQILQVRGGSSSAELTRAVEKTLAQLDPNVPVGVVQTMEEVVDGLNGLFLYRMGAGLALGLGLLGLFLAVVGVYGVVAYAAAQRTHEIGVRVALGARPAQVVRAVVRNALVMVGTGAAFGLLLALGFAKLVSAFLMGVSALDPATYLLAVAALAAAALAASLVPAWRALRGDPLAALRCE